MKYLLIALTMMISSVTFASSSMAPKGKAEVDLSKSVVNWKGTKKITKDKHVGTMKLKSATIAEENGKLKSATVVMDINSIDCTDLSGEWKQKFEGHIKSPDFLNTAKFPTATLNVTKVALITPLGSIAIHVFLCADKILKWCKSPCNTISPLCI